MIRFNIKTLRAAHNMTQKELIDKSGIRPSTLSGYENNSAKTISIEHIDKLCEVLNCQPAELMTYLPADKEYDEYVHQLTQIIKDRESLSNYMEFHSKIKELEYLYGLMIQHSLKK